MSFSQAAFAEQFIFGGWQHVEGKLARGEMKPLSDGGDKKGA